MYIFQKSKLYSNIVIKKLIKITYLILEKADKNFRKIRVNAYIFVKKTIIQLLIFRNLD